MLSDIPRRINSQQWTEAERAIFGAIQVVEQVGPHPFVAEALTLLIRAKEKIADYVDMSTRTDERAVCTANTLVDGDSAKRMRCIRELGHAGLHQYIRSDDYVQEFTDSDAFFPSYRESSLRRP